MKKGLPPHPLSKTFREEDKKALYQFLRQSEKERESAVQRADMESAPTILFLLILCIFNGVKVFQEYRGILDVSLFSRKIIRFLYCQFLRETWNYGIGAIFASVKVPKASHI